jgi:glycosyltransferase involved in cell wall biosynthesis
MPKPLTIYSHLPRLAHAGGVYRIAVVTETARDLGLPVRVVMDNDSAGINPEWRVKNFCESDVVMLYHPIGDGNVHNSRMAKSIIPSKRDGEWKYPPTIVVETDDNLFNVSPYNPAFKSLGLRDQEGKEIELGYKIGAIEAGDKKVLWIDRRNPEVQTMDPDDRRIIDLAANKHNLDTYRNMLELSDLVSCTTPRLEQHVKDNARVRRTQVFPNLVRFDHYPQVALAEEPGKIKILWQGGAAHHEDWYPLRWQLAAITKRYPQVHWIIWGQMYHWAMGLIPPDRYTFISWCPYHEYKLRLCMVGHDINLAPLQGNRFNDCRSAIKFYESSVLKKPVATLAQATGPYRDEIKDGETGLLFKDSKEFGMLLSRLIENEAERKMLASNARDWVSENRDAMKEVPKYIRNLEVLREEIKRDQPHMPDSEWDAFVKNYEEQEAAEQARAENNLEPAAR